MGMTDQQPSQSACETCAALRGTIDSILEAIKGDRFTDGLVTAEQYVQHTLGTIGHLYHVQGFIDVVKERDEAYERGRRELELRKALELAASDVTDLRSVPADPEDYVARAREILAS